MVNESLHQNTGIIFNKQGFLLNTFPLTRQGPEVQTNGASILEVTYVPPLGSTTPIKSCRFQIALNVILVVAFFIFFVMVEFYGYGFNISSGFTCKDVSLSYKHQKDMVSFWTLMSGCLVVLPVWYLVIIWLLNKKFTKRGIREILLYYKEYLKGMMLLITVCESIKALVGEPRPDFFDVCSPDTARNCTPGEYVESFSCENLKKYGARKMYDSNRSFPSGHAAMSAFTTVFCWYLVETKFPITRLGEGLKCVFLLVAVVWSLICSLTRISDHRHHYWDVLGGAVIGVSWGVYTINNIYKNIDRFSNPGNNLLAKNYVTSNSLGRTIVR